MTEGNRRPLLVADLFCGAGGSSTGARRALAALGHDMTLVAVNHWNVAIETHSRNHPEARHYLRDLMAADPIQLVPEGKLDLLMASPTCTHHSRARGGKPSSDQQRMDPWAIVRWCAELRVKRLLIENVPEFTEWGPLDLRTGRPIRRRKGEYFRAWVEALKGLGFKLAWRNLNAADYGDATTRVRFFLIARSDGRKLSWPAPTHSRDGGDLFGSRKWRAAREVIDWSLEGRSIYDRKKPLAAATLARIEAGLVKFRWPEPYLVVLRRHMAAQSLDAPLPSLCAGGTHVGLAEPFLLNRHGDNGSVRGHDLAAPMPTADCRGAGYLVEPDAFVCGNRTNNTAKSVDEPVGGITTTTGGGQFLVEPFLANLAHAGADRSRCLPLGEPLQTLHAGGGSHALIAPFVLSQGSNGSPRSVTEPVPTILTGGKTALVEPFMLSQASGGAPREVAEPVPAIPTGGAHALIAPYYGSGSGATCGTVEDPLPTATAKARFGLVIPITHADGSNRSRSVDAPLATITTAHRGELALIVAAFGERPGEAPPTQAGRDWDIRFRMLQPHELAAAMGFAGDDAAYEFAGNKTEVTKQIGNAVAVNTACALVRALAET